MEKREKMQKQSKTYLKRLEKAKELRKVQDQVELRLLDVENRIFHARSRQTDNLEAKKTSLSSRNKNHDDKCITHKVQEELLQKVFSDILFV